MKVKSLSGVQLFATPWTAAYQAPPSMGFSRQEYWSGVPLPSPTPLINTDNDFHIKKGNISKFKIINLTLQFSSVTQSCPILCDPTDRSMPGLPVHHQLPKLAQIHVGDAHPTISSFVVPFSSRLQSFPASGSFPMTQLLTGEGNGNPLQYSCLENPMDGGAW